ncbi:hypothetical protein DA075_27730 [Methylobacterium currus]|uniref:Uncharacterized protein n=1 Tax=Methylobacterium currus TaxID=2051553 RepID=A0A2R4WRM8_9HYPH|nr:hypothetical protein DA075_27730 [Methylobacterium currus]
MFRREIIRRIVAAQPSVLDDRRIMAMWLNSFARETRAAWTGPQMVALDRRYANGTEFDRDAVMDELKQFLTAQATVAPLTIARVRLVPLPPYDRARGGFLLQGATGLSDTGNEYIGSGPPIVAKLDEMPDASLLKMDVETAQTLTRDLGNMRYVQVVTRIALRDFQSRADSGSSGPTAAAKVMDVSVHLPPRIKGQRFGVRIGQIAVGGALEPPPLPRVGGGTPAIDTWKAFGVPTAGDRLFVAWRSDYRSDSVDPFLKPLQLQALAAEPRLAGTLPAVHELARRYLSPREIAGLFGGRPDNALLREVSGNPFRRKDIIERFGREHLPRLIAAAPRMPVKVRMAVPVRIVDYDFQTSALQVGMQLDGGGSAPGGMYLPRLFPDWQTTSDIVKLPTRIPLEQERARALIARWRQLGTPTGDGIARIYAALDLELTGGRPAAPERDVGTLSETSPYSAQLIRGPLSARFEALTFFEDAAMTRRIDGLSGAVERYRAPVKEVDPLGSGDAMTATPLNSWGLIGVAARAGAGADFAQAAVLSSHAVRNTNEFDRPALVDRLKTAIANGTPENGRPFHLPGNLTLGEYDGGSFGMRTWRVGTAVPQNLPSPSTNSLTIEIANPETLIKLPVDPRLAKPMVAGNSSREFRAVFRVQEVSAERRDSDTTAAASLTVQIVGILVMHPREPNRILLQVSAGTVQASPATGRKDQVSLAARPTRVPMDRDTLYLLLQREAGGEPDDDALRSHLLGRWEIENTNDPYNGATEPAWGRFFPRNYRRPTEADITRFLPSFRRWNELRRDALPMKATVLWFPNPSGSAMQFGKSSNFMPIMAHFGFDKDQFMKLYYGMYTHPMRYEVPDGGAPYFKGGVLAFWRGTVNTENHDMYLYVPDLPAPRLTGSDQIEYRLYMDVDLRIVAREPRPGQPLRLALAATPTELRWWSGQTAVQRRRLLATIPVERPVGESAALSPPAIPPAGLTTAPATAAPASPAAPPPVRPTAPYDVLGVKLGMDVAEAEAIVQSAMEIEHRLTLTPPPGSPPLAFAHAQVFVSKDLKQYVALVTEPSRSGGRVLAVGRYLFGGMGAFDLRQLMQALDDKYGSHPLTIDNLRYWGGSRTGGRTEQHCFVAIGGLSAGKWTDAQGREPDFGALTLPGSVANWRGPASMPWMGLRLAEFQKFGLYRDCGPAVAAWIPEINGRAGEMAIWLVDTKVYIDVITGPLGPQGGQEGVKFKL